MKVSPGPSIHRPVLRVCRPSPGGLAARAGSLRDLEECRALQEGMSRLPSLAGPRDWLGLWRHLLQLGAMHISLVEGRVAPTVRKPISFLASVFVSDDFCAAARSTFSPNLVERITRDAARAEGRILDQRQVARANAGDGVNVVIGFGGCSPEFGAADECCAAREKQVEAFHLVHRGFRVKEMLFETHRQEILGWSLAAGFRLRHHRAKARERTRGSWLLGLTREEALKNPGCRAFGLFVHTPPRFYFAPSEQTLLDRALLGETDNELASALYLSCWTVKKRWKAIYERIGDVDRTLLPPRRDGQKSTRGSERRRHLMHYLRQHLEELRPYHGSRI